MTWFIRIVLFIALFLLAVFSRTYLFLAQLTVAVLLLYLLLYYYNKLPDFLTAPVDRLVYRSKTGRVRRPQASPRREQTSQNQAAPGQARQRSTAKPRQRTEQPPPQTKPRASASTGEENTNNQSSPPESGSIDLFKLFDARKFSDSIQNHILSQREAATELTEAIKAYFSKVQPIKPLSILILGGDSSGKTTLLKNIPVSLSYSLPPEVRVIPDYQLMMQGTTFNVSGHKPKHQSKRLINVCLDNISALTEANQSHLSALLDSAEMSGLILVCSLNTRTDSENSETSSTPELEPSLLARFDHVIRFSELSKVERMRVLGVILHNIINDEYRITLEDGENQSVRLLTMEAEEVWRRNHQEGVHAAKQFIEKAVSKPLQAARVSNWQSVTISNYNPDTQTLSVKPV